MRVRLHGAQAFDVTGAARDYHDYSLLSSPQWNDVWACWLDGKDWFISMPIVATPLLSSASFWDSCLCSDSVFTSNWQVFSLEANPTCDGLIHETLSLHQMANRLVFSQLEITCKYESIPVPFISKNATSREKLLPLNLDIHRFEQVYHGAFLLADGEKVLSSLNNHIQWLNDWYSDPDVPICCSLPPSSSSSSSIEC